MTAMISQALSIIVTIMDNGARIDLTDSSWFRIETDKNSSKCVRNGSSTSTELRRTYVRKERRTSEGPSESPQRFTRGRRPKPAGLNPSHRDTHPDSTFPGNSSPRTSLPLRVTCTNRDLERANYWNVLLARWALAKFASKRHLATSFSGVPLPTHGRLLFETANIALLHRASRPTSAQRCVLPERTSLGHRCKV
jgi:hypothetical protein